ncbi:hypothetical protein PoB_004676000 [Plakobranchus ocellatus]|uniref:Uncharacterized protein n=1 Tax=Plakobranchus ocellatus TaxID=259542 RepID=A0AAV4BLD8_9GAST|nr:hypothetical protein PoB_004676000 [Plakobranchus ocellatus]
MFYYPDSAAGKSQVQTSSEVTSKKLWVFTSDQVSREAESPAILGLRKYPDREALRPGLLVNGKVILPGSGNALFINWSSYRDYYGMIF